MKASILCHILLSVYVGAFSEFSCNQPIVRKFNKRFQLNTPVSTAPITGRFPNQSVLELHSAGTAAVAISSSFQAVSRLVATLSVGAGFAHFGFLPKASLRTISSLIYGIFQPSLLFSNVSRTLTRVGGGTEVAKTLAILPMFSLVQIMSGYLIGKLLLKVRHSALSKDNPDYRELLLSCTFGNSGPLPFLFVDAMNMGSTAIGYISFYLLGWSPIFWTFGAKLLNPAKDSESLSKVLITPPSVGCLAGALVGSITILNKLILGPGAFLSPIMNTVNTLGTSYLPCVGLTLAGSLYYALFRVNEVDEISPCNEHSVALWSKVLTLGIARFIIMPLFGVTLISLLSKFSIIPSNDKLLKFILMLQCCMPSAQNGVVILQLSEETSHLAGSMARTISSLYISSIIPLAILLQFAYRFAGF